MTTSSAPVVEMDLVVLHTDAATGLTYTWLEASPHPADITFRERGILSSMLAVATPDGEQVAYLRLAYTTPEFVAHVFPTTLDWAEENTGHTFGLQDAARMGVPVRPATVWVKAHVALSKKPKSSTRPYHLLTPSDAPTDPDALAADMRAVTAPLDADRAAWTAWYTEFDVTFTRVNPEYRRHGIARQMYILAAQHIAKRGRVITASTTQSDDAQGMWASFLADPTMPTATVARRGLKAGKPERVCNTLDFTTAR